MEVWVSLQVNSVYSVSNLGGIRSDNWKNSGKRRLVLPATDKKGYQRVGLIVDGKLKTFKLHRLIAMAFIDNPEQKPQVNHKNGIKNDNRVENLEWVTNSENIAHAIKNGLAKAPVCPKDKKAKGSRNGQAKLTESDVIEIRRKFKPRVYTRKMLAQEYNVSHHTIKDVILRRWNHV